MAYGLGLLGCLVVTEETGLLGVAPATWYWPRLLFTAVFVRVVNMDRTAVAAPLIAFYLTAMLLVRNTNFMWLLVGWLAIDFALFISLRSRGPKYVFYALLGILVLHALAIPGSIVWGSGTWVLTAFVLLWMAPNIMLYLMNVRASVFQWLVPSWLIHTALILYQGLTNWHWDGVTLIREEAPRGLANNPNLAAGFLLLGIVYMLFHPKFKWLTPPMLVAMLFTGSRWGLIVCVAVLLAMLISRRIDWKPLAATLVLGGVFLLGFFYLAPLPFEIAGYDSFNAVVGGIPTDVGHRLAVPHIPSMLPKGVAEHPGLHNVPLRMAYENGIAAAVLWVGVSLWALTRWKNGVCWWLLLTLVALSMLDYYSFAGHLGGFWWLCVGMLVKREVEV